MNKKGYAVRWENQTYFMSNLTVQVKDDFCAWLVRLEIANAYRLLDANAALKTQRMILASPPKWTAENEHPDVAVILGTPEGDLQLNRLLFGLTQEEMSDADLKRMMEEKMEDEASDYRIALSEINEASDPKAKGAGDSSPAPKDDAGSMQHSVVNPSTEDQKNTPA